VQLISKLSALESSARQLHPAQQFLMLPTTAPAQRERQKRIVSDEL
jgi:hypothetical protein